MENRLSYLPSRLRGRLMAFQKEGVVFALKNAGRCLIADEMGLGKTLQALSAAYFFRNEWPLLIIVPSSIRYSWIEEIEKWLPEINPRDINLVMSGMDVGNIPTARISIVTYGLIRHPACKLVREALVKQKFQVLILDESHMIKNRKSAGTKFLVPLLRNAKRKFLLTGTPALSRPEELFPQLEALDPKRFNNWNKFAQRYCDAHVQKFGRISRYITSGVSNAEELHSVLTTSLMIRRLKSAVLTQLPPKQRQKIPFDLKDSELKKVLNCACSNSTWTRVEPRFFVFENHFLFAVNFILISLQLGPVKDYVKMMCESCSEKMIVFAHHIMMLDSVCQTLIENKIQFIRIDGSTCQQDRPHFVRQFQVDPSIRIAVLSMKAAGVGLTLTAANVVIFAELDWTPGHMEQCEDRAHRIGQKSNVNVHYLVANGTVDSYMWSALCRKTTVVTTTLNGCTKTLEAEFGDGNAVQCLSNAEAYDPEKLKTNDSMEFFPTTQSQTVRIYSDENSEFRTNRCKPTKYTDESFNATLDNDRIEISLEDTVESPQLKESDIVETPKLKRKRRRKLIVPNEESPPAAKPPSDKWSCCVCTFLNHDVLPYCEICTTPKSKVRKTDSDISTSVLLTSQEDNEVVLLSSQEEDNSVSSSTQEDTASSLPSQEEYTASSLSSQQEDTASLLPCQQEDTASLLPFNVYKEGFRFCCSLYTSRVHLFDINGKCLQMNFVPMDITMKNLSELPDTLLHPTNFRHLTVFMKQWNSLSVAKQRMVIRHGEPFLNPVLLYEEQLKGGRKLTNQRYLTKANLASAAAEKAKSVNGTLRLISRSSPKQSKKAEKCDDTLRPSQMSKHEFVKAIQEADESRLNNMEGYVQAVNAQGVPLCINCHKEFPSNQVSASALRSHAWQTRLCSVSCTEQYWLKSSREYGRKAVYDAEHGQCQLCGIEAHQFFTNLNMIHDRKKRAEMIQNSKFNQLHQRTKQKMVVDPQAGQFWQVDHILPVVDGGGQCDLDNLRTLCSVCHNKVTSDWMKERTKEKRRMHAGDITAFFKRS
ncbi:hypothetical protein CAPTEDRAFT_113875 [Capitella teleta]|uniref:DNA annealing helicase and endonuclease ZRANB3 n=1 Tax=Capitella teleta TaxID=283909 RepID=R7T9Q8_CAPTE|nr:hypothetical protein CAPTEDRAFT_113875 [Capitella teleta]|eukprot:ELT88125.1 hypothetical protein CAPTEDRAFT_113875 [Capitella teleta]